MFNTKNQNSSSISKEYVYKFLFVLLIASNSCFAEVNNYWQDVQISKSKSLDVDLDLKPGKFRSLQLDIDSLKNELNKTARKSNNTNLVMPNPDGSFSTFIVSEYKIMEDELAKKFPEIKTYHGYNKSNPIEKIYLDVTPKGLHGMTVGGEHSVWIDPMSRSNNKSHINYFKKDYGNKRKPHQCKVHGSIENRNLIDQSKNTSKELSKYTKHENTLRTYRLAISAQAEYTEFHSKPKAANVSDGLAALVTAMVRINGVYENELAIRMILVGDNNKIVYTNPSTDPFTETGDSSNQNQISIDEKVGFNNYDIGHVFLVGGGGVASLQSPCNLDKAQAETAGDPPENDPFWIDYVAHEMGHQWGGHHSYNSLECESQRSPYAAYEPGGGTTIQAYAGICGPDDIQAASDPYFHTISLEQMNAYATMTAGNSAGGQTCGALITTNNKAPIITTGTGYVIPTGTPFELCASASDADTSSSQLTYTWEQFDLGEAGNPNNPIGNVPLFRSFKPTTNPCRTFPQQSDLLNNTQTIGEILPTISRPMNFRITVRDNELGGGAFNTAETAMTVVKVDVPFKLTSPNGGEVFNHGENMDVTWDVANTNVEPINCPNVNIMASNNGGKSFPFSVRSNTPNDGIESVPVPAINSNEIRFKIKCSTSVFFDISNTNLQIKSSVNGDIIYQSGFETKN